MAALDRVPHFMRTLSVSMSLEWTGEAPQAPGRILPVYLRPEDDGHKHPIGGGAACQSCPLPSVRGHGGLPAPGPPSLVLACVGVIWDCLAMQAGRGICLGEACPCTGIAAGNAAAVLLRPRITGLPNFAEERADRSPQCFLQSRRLQ